MVPPFRTGLGRLVILLFLVCELSGSGGLPFSDIDVLSLIDPIEQFDEDSEAKKVVVKSVFNVPIKTEPTVPPCPAGTRRVTETGSCIPKSSGIKLDDNFLLQSFTNFNRRRPTPSSASHTSPGKRRRVSSTTPRYDHPQNPVPTYILEEDLDSGGAQEGPFTPTFNVRPQHHTGPNSHHHHNSYARRSTTTPTPTTTSTTPSSMIDMGSIIFPTEEINPNPSPSPSPSAESDSDFIKQTVKRSTTTTSTTITPPSSMIIDKGLFIFPTEEIINTTLPSSELDFNHTNQTEEDTLSDTTVFTSSSVDDTTSLNDDLIDTTIVTIESTDETTLNDTTVIPSSDEINSSNEDTTTIGQELLSSVHETTSNDSASTV